MMTPIRILLVNNLTPEFSVLQILSVQILHELSDTQVVISSAVSSFTQPRTMDPSENAREKMKAHTLEVSRTVNKEDQKHLRSFIVKHPRSLYRYGSPPQDTTYSYESPRLTQFLLFFAVASYTKLILNISYVTCISAAYFTVVGFIAPIRVLPNIESTSSESEASV